MLLRAHINRLATRIRCGNALRRGSRDAEEEHQEDVRQEGRIELIELQVTPDLMFEHV